MPHNSIFVLGPETNKRWLHGIRADKRRQEEKSREEKSFGGERISITFRQIGTFTCHDNRTIWGQGARSKTQATAGIISTTNSGEMDAMIKAFGKENQQVDFDWDQEYGSGFDVVNLISTVPQLYLCNDEIANLRVKLSLLKHGVPCDFIQGPPDYRTTTSKPKTIFALSGDENPVFRDIDEASSEIVGDLAILFYLGKVYPLLPSKPLSPQQMHQSTTQVFSRVTQANEILYLWQELSGSSLTDSTRRSHSLRRQTPDHGSSGAQPASDVKMSKLDEFKGELDIWEDYAEETEFIGGEYYSVVDCAFWPVLNDIVHKWDGWNETKYPDLAAYHHNVGQMESVRKALALRVRKNVEAETETETDGMSTTATSTSHSVRR